MEGFVTNYLGEIIVSIVLGLLAWAFKSWSFTLEMTTKKILEKLEKLSTEFHDHRVQVESRVTRVETKVDMAIGRSLLSPSIRSYEKSNQ